MISMMAWLKRHRAVFVGDTRHEARQLKRDIKDNEKGRLSECGLAIMQRDPLGWEFQQDATQKTTTNDNSGDNEACVGRIRTPKDPNHATQTNPIMTIKRDGTTETEK
uniref:AlNc14C53G4110 protein n=1 Tax=Albugo laibachii Nc14 TaxID=890382 RepID=F0WBR9_9STRA|nr:AlNc14C53G4110 [Albugo laibachii Nc14]CCA20553.1 AlNc14C97G5913 [Albugo laibachii Nc14]|eukprot:CCA20553.1 AlNc14C97G5913 [Albugo laibachii Nc14]